MQVGHQDFAIDLVLRGLACPLAIAADRTSDVKGVHEHLAGPSRLPSAWRARLEHLHQAS